MGRIKITEKWEIDSEDGINIHEPEKKGGPGSGNFGHSGRPGQVGGSGTSGGSDYRWSGSGYAEEVGPGAKERVGRFCRMASKQLGIDVQVNEEAIKAGIDRHVGGFADQIARAKRVYPEIDKLLGDAKSHRDLVINVEQISDNPRFADENGNLAPAGTDACYTHSRGEITINNSMIGKKDFEKYDLTPANVMYRPTVDYGVAPTFSHELGHKVGQCLSNVGKNMFVDWLGNNLSDVYVKVSSYSNSSAAEAFAECFSMTVHPGFEGLTKTSNFHLNMLKMMRDVISVSADKTLSVFNRGNR